MNFDALDRKLLHELDQNARASYAELARKVRHGSDIVRYRVERLLSEGTIESCSVIWDARRIGMCIYKSYLKLRPDRKRLEVLIQKLSRSNRIYWIAESYGRWDFIFSIVASDPGEFLEIEDKLLSAFSDLILERELFTIIELNRYPKNYLVGKQSKVIVQGAEPARLELDEIDKGLLAQLSVDARLSWTELAERLGTSPAITKYRTERLEQQKIIVGYRVQLNYQKFGYMLFKVLVSLRNSQSATKLREICQKNHNITVFIRQLGGWLYEFEAEVPDYLIFNQLIDEVREEMGESISSLEYMLIRKDHYHRAKL